MAVPLGLHLECHYLLCLFETCHQASPPKRLAAWPRILPTSQAIWIFTIRWPVVVQHPLIWVAHFTELRAAITSSSFALSFHCSIALWCLFLRVLGTEHADHCICHRIHMSTASCSITSCWVAWCAGTSNCVHQLLANWNCSFGLVQSCAEFCCAKPVRRAVLILGDVCHWPGHTACFKPQFSICWPAALHNTSEHGHAFGIQLPSFICHCNAVPSRASLKHPCNHGFRRPGISKGWQLKCRAESRHSRFVNTTPNRNVLVGTSSTSENCHFAWAKRCRDCHSVRTACGFSCICTGSRWIGGVHSCGLCWRFHSAIQGCIRLHGSWKPTKQSEHEGHHHHKTNKRSENEKIPSMLHWALITAAFEVQEAQGANQCPHALALDEHPSRVVTSFQSSNILVVEAQNSHQTSEASRWQSLRSNVSWVHMAADTAKPNSATGNECL